MSRTVRRPPVGRYKSSSKDFVPYLRPDEIRWFRETPCPPAQQPLYRRVATYEKLPRYRYERVEETYTFEGETYVRERWEEVKTKKFDRVKRWEKVLNNPDYDRELAWERESWLNIHTIIYREGCSRRQRLKAVRWTKRNQHHKRRREAERETRRLVAEHFLLDEVEFSDTLPDTK